MIRLQQKEETILPIPDPDNLIPYLYRCGDCGCVIRKVEETQSFVLVSIHKDIESGKRKICPFCYRLREYNRE
jgi:hypothetical protein